MIVHKFRKRLGILVGRPSYDEKYTKYMVVAIEAPISDELAVYEEIRDNLQKLGWIEVAGITDAG